MDDLALTRALGDLHLATYVSPVPHFCATRVAFSQSPFFIIGCDGVWDVLAHGSHRARTLTAWRALFSPIARVLCVV
jgi:serine/threonine protein phosphatase PrpC